MKRMMVVLLVSGLLSVSVMAADQVMTLAPLSDGAVASVDVTRAIEKSDGTILGTLKTIVLSPVTLVKEYPKLSTGAILAAAGLIVANNPQLIGLEKKDKGAGGIGGDANSTVALNDESMTVTVSGSGNTINIYSNRDSDNTK